jgi:hypothetical protein
VEITMPLISLETEHRIAEAVEQTDVQRILIAHDSETMAAVAVVVAITDEGPRIAAWIASAPIEREGLHDFAAGVHETLEDGLRAHLANGRPVTIN